MADFSEFVSPAYRLETKNAACSVMFNLFLSTIEQGPRKGKLRLRNVPGMKRFATVSDMPVRGLLEIDGGNRLFAVSGATVFEVFRDGTSSALLGSVGLNSHPVTMAANGFQIAIASAGQLYMANAGTGGAGTVTPVYFTQSDGTATSDPLRAATVTFLNNYFIVNQVDSKQLFVSNLAPDGAIWNPEDTAIKEGYPDNIAAVFADNAQLWIFGNDKSTEVWQGSANPFPFERIGGSVIPIACSAPYSVAGAAGYRFWFWNNVAYAAYGQDPQRISDSGVEQAWRTYPQTSDAEGWCQIFGQHLFWCISFPSAKRTWFYDLTHKCWHERGTWINGQQGIYRGRVYAKAFGKELVGDPETGDIWELDEETFTDANGGVLRRQRTADYITYENKNQRYNQFTLDCDTGIGLDVAPDQPGYDPQVIFRYSDNRGKTWSSEQTASLGRIGEDDTRVIFNQGGSSRIGKVFDTVFTDPVPTSINGAYLKIGQREAGR